MKLCLQSSAGVAERREAMLGCGRFGDKGTTPPPFIWLEFFKGASLGKRMPSSIRARDLSRLHETGSAHPDALY
jgi:hypothetical protein